MKALTLKQPWAWAVAHAGKDVENRSWKPPQSIIGQRIAIHAGLARERGALRDIGLDIDVPLFLDQGAFVAVATVAGWVTGEGQFCIARGVDTFLPIASSRSPWFFGTYGWMLTDVVALTEPIECKGQQGLWNVPPEVEAEINRQVKP